MSRIWYTWHVHKYIRLVQKIEPFVVFTVTFRAFPRRLVIDKLADSVPIAINIAVILRKSGLYHNLFRVQMIGLLRFLQG